MNRCPRWNDYSEKGAFATTSAKFGGANPSTYRVPKSRRILSKLVAGLRRTMLRRDNWSWFLSARHHIQPVQEILAKLALSNQGVQIAMRGCNHSHVNRNRPAAANAFDFTFLQNSQECNLDFRRKVADFIEKDRAATGRFEPSHSSLRGTSKSAFFVTKE